MLLAPLSVPMPPTGPFTGWLLSCLSHLLATAQEQVTTISVLPNVLRRAGPKDRQGEEVERA